MDRLLKKVPTLTKLDLVHGHKGLKWSKRTAKALAAGIAGNTRLRDLALDCSMFDQEQEHQIIIALRSNTALTVLCLPGISEHGATHLAPALEHNQIVSLSFYSEWKTDKDDTFITDGDNLYETGTGAGSIGDAGAEALGRYLARCSSLTEADNVQRFVRQDQLTKRPRQAYIPLLLRVKLAAMPGFQPRTRVRMHHTMMRRARSTRSWPLLPA